MVKKVLLFLSIGIALVLVISGAQFARQQWIVRVSRQAYQKRLQERLRPSRPPARFYLSSSGNDAAAGTSPDQAWRTISKVNGADFVAGDSILLEGGSEFEGNLHFDARNFGLPTTPITIASYGHGRATIRAGDGDGIRADNAAGFRIENLQVAGSGSLTNHGDGICFVNDLAGDIKMDFIRIDQVEVSGFGKHGIRLDAKTSKSGYRDVRITNVTAHNNVIAGIYVYGSHNNWLSRKYAHENFYIGHCRAFHNSGLRDAKVNNTGSGIVLADADGGVIEHSLAYENGWLCDSKQGGPVGIWAWDSNRITIQYNESWANRTAGVHDGGGFDLDGGMTNSVMQYNYSHDNDGAGYMICQFPYARPSRNNTVRYNISQNDGRRNGLGGLMVYGAVERLDLYHNTVYMTVPAHGNPSPVLVDGEECSRVNFRSNILETAGGLSVIDVKTGQKGVVFQDNDYYTVGAPLEIAWYGNKYRNLEQWGEATGQEKLNGRGVGRIADPGLAEPGASGAAAFQLRKGSPLIDAGLDLKTMFGIDPGPRDFYGAPIPRGSNFDVGAHEYSEAVH